MEFTEQEIEMFGKAHELQEAWVPKRGDWFYKADGLGHGLWLICTIVGQTLFCAGEGMHSEAFKGNLVEFRNPQNYTWIPSAEDLQVMICDNDYTIVHHGGAGDPWELNRGAYMLAGIPLKLLLLSLVMYEKYGRKWSGKTWYKLPKPKSAKIK